MFQSQRKDGNRMHIAVPVRLTWQDADGEAHDCDAWTLNVSGRGAALQIPNDLALPRRLRIRSDDYQFRADAEVLVVWERSKPQRAIGVRLDPRARRVVWEAR
jgi:hypothetical protein